MDKEEFQEDIKDELENLKRLGSDWHGAWG